MYHMNTEEGRNNYNELRRRTDVTIVEEKDHWEQGQLRRYLEYDETTHVNTREVDLEKQNGIPSRAGDRKPPQPGEEDQREDDGELDDDEKIFPNSGEYGEPDQDGPELEPPN